jgi:hypothetical protein
MRDMVRSATTLGLGTLCALVLALPVSAGEPSTVEPSETAPAPSEPAPTETTSPESTDVTADSSAPDTTVGTSEPDDDINRTVTVIAVIGFILLLGVASWWMVRRQDPDAQPMPPASDVPPSDLI